MLEDENCNYCARELIEGKTIVYEREGMASYCDDNCLVGDIRKHSHYYMDLMIENGMIEQIKHEK